MDNRFRWRSSMHPLHDIQKKEERQSDAVLTAEHAEVTEEKNSPPTPRTRRTQRFKSPREED